MKQSYSFLKEAHNTLYSNLFNKIAIEMRKLIASESKMYDELVKLSRLTDDPSVKYAIKNVLDTLYKTIRSNSEVFDTRLIQSNLDAYQKKADKFIYKRRA